ncbi:MAG TPA: FG-GAP-like repeat-containing protein [Planctomycetota bacterium]|jgi:hypothetical protein|nr:FG-GAP-like repeat-containing protein [Planctomycetota bacterium]
MRLWTCLSPAFLVFASLARAQQFGFTHTMIPPDRDASRAVALGDLDGDGDLDAFVGNYQQQSRLHLNDGTGVFTDVTATSLPALVDFSQAVALGDVDGDGDFDAFAANLVQNRLYLNGGTGSFTDATATNLPALADSAQAVALGDVDGDGDLDAFLGIGGLGQVRLYSNGGTGIFTDVTATSLPFLVANTGALALGDVDGDGDLDAFLAAYGQQDRLYLNGGTGIFADATATNLPAQVGYTQAVALGDVDGDGDLDAFLGAYAQQSRLYLNGGGGAFTDVTATNLPALVEDTYVVALGDVDGDGDLDAFLGSYAVPSGAQNRLHLNGGSGIFTEVTATNLPARLDTTLGVALGDVDGDGDLDAFVANNGRQNRIDLNDGGGVFTDVTGTGLPAPVEDTEAVALGDVDGDGDLDALVGNSTASGPAAPDRLYLNGGAGVFTDATSTSLPAPLDPTLAVALGDVDGDGDLDALAGNSATSGPGAPDRLYLNAGTGVFSDVTATNLPPSFDVTRAIALGDVDGDGDLDLFKANGDPSPSLQQNRLYLNGGAGVFADVTATNLPALLADARAVALGDVDGDGDLDAFVGNYWQQSLLYLNGGSGAFTVAAATNLPLVAATRAVALGDVDGDGDLDAFIGNDVVYNRLFLNGGTGVFTDATATNLPVFLFSSARAVALGDVDGDGDLDALLGNSGTPVAQNRLYLNGGTGVFTDATAMDLPALLEDTRAIALGDVDGDGDLDAFVAVDGQDRILTNLSRQLSWRGIPRAGKPLALDLRGPATGTWLLAASAASSDIPLPPFGTLRLLPSTLFIVAGGALDPQGRASVSFLVPANAALVGLSLYWQAVVGPPLRFTNLEVTTVTNL